MMHTTIMLRTKILQKRRTDTTPFASVLFILSFTQGFSQIKINEFLASNTTIPDEFGEFDDWVEPKNTGSAAIDIGGYYFSDVPASPLGYQVPTTNPSLTTIPVGGYGRLVRWPTNARPAHALPKLSAGGESIVITGPHGVTLVDSYTFPAQTANISMGRIPDGTGGFVFMQPPSPNAVNVSTPPSTTAVMPTASVAAGFYTSTLVCEPDHGHPKCHHLLHPRWRCTHYFLDPVHWA